jgi:hypothetical protein
MSYKTLIVEKIKLSLISFNELSYVLQQLSEQQQ